MDVKRRAYIRSVGRFLPEKRLTNKDLERMVDTSDEWIVSRTGIRERRILDPGLGNSYMAVRAARECLERAGVSAETIDVIIVATVTPDMFFPATACLVQHDLGAHKAWGYDLSAGCSAFLFALSNAAQFIESGRYDRVLVIGSDVASTIVDYTDRNTCIIFGDAAGAVLVEPCPDPQYGILDFIQRCDGSGGQYLHMKAGGSRRPASFETVRNREHYIYQEGSQVFKMAVTEMASVTEQIITQNGLSENDIKYLVPHQANLRIIQATSEKTGIPMERIVVNIDRFANTIGATIPLCLYDVIVEGNKVKTGDYLVISAFGAGYTWGSMLIRWWENNDV